MILALCMTLLYGYVGLWLLRTFSRAITYSVRYMTLIALSSGVIISMLILSTPYLISRASSLLTTPAYTDLITSGTYQYITISILILYSLVRIVGYALISRGQIHISLGISIGYIVSILGSRILRHLLSPIKSLLILLIVSTEEFLKIVMTVLWHQRQHTRVNDLIIIWIVVGLWFWIIENIWYLIQQAQKLSAIDLLSLSSMRSVSSSMIHICCTWGIARMITRSYHQSHIWRYASYAVVVFTWYHLLYNLSLQYVSILTLILVIGWYILLSRYLYDVDILYISDITTSRPS